MGENSGSFDVLLTKTDALPRDLSDMRKVVRFVIAVIQCGVCVSDISGDKLNKQNQLRQFGLFCRLYEDGICEFSNRRIG